MKTDKKKVSLSSIYTLEVRSSGLLEHLLDIVPVSSQSLVHLLLPALACLEADPAALTH